jgi:hypothetical protein
MNTQPEGAADHEAGQHSQRYPAPSDEAHPSHPADFALPCTLLVLDDTFAVCRLAGDAAIPPWATGGGFFSITRTADELSVVCRQAAVPEGVLCERGWRCLRVAGTIPFAAVGVLASLTTPLAEAGVSVVAVSTYDTDYVLLKEKDLAGAVDALQRRGHTVR